ncbi:N-6 DNA methylase [Nocardia sp. CA-107356]|uniref:N-6 DNA methylase n=1 Tax=Nocardia sp. CA-107356 TaxID=3239972 RepID=UPI003D926E1B
MSQPNAIPVTLAEIARIAGVGRAAASNWRRRHDTFPAPIGGTDVSPQFSLTEVEAWLRDQGKLRDIGEKERLWPQFDALGDRAETGRAIAVTALKQQHHDVVLESEPELSLSHSAEHLVDRAIALAEREGPREVFEFLLGRWLDTHVRQISSTPEPLAQLMAEIAERVRTGTESSGPRTVLDPACGSGGLLRAAADVCVGGSDGMDPVLLAGAEKDPVLAALAAARLSLTSLEDTASRPWTVDVRTADSLREDSHPDLRVDLVLCNPPFNERDWGYEELATDPRWVYGLPPRTEPELAWVEHAVSKLRPGGVAVLLLPPAAASRKAGRRIRGALLRAGVLRAVIALPSGCAPPHSVALQLWVLQADRPGQRTDVGHSVHLIDAGDAAKNADGLDWIALRSGVFAAIGVKDHALRQDSPGDFALWQIRSVTVPTIDLLDDEVDLTPARHVPAGSSGSFVELRESWSRFSTLLAEVQQSAGSLSSIGLSAKEDGQPGITTIGELARAGALVVYAGQLPAEGSVRTGAVSKAGVPFLAVSDLLMGGEPGGWIPEQEVAAAALRTTERNDVIVSGVTRAFFAWVEDRAATVLGPQLYALRVDPAKLDPWFLAGCLRAPANGRQAGTHTSSSARVDVRKLQVLQVPIAEQRRYGEVFRQVVRFEQTVQELGDLGAVLVRELSNNLSAGRLSQS